MHLLLFLLPNILLLHFLILIFFIFFYLKVEIENCLFSFLTLNLNYKKLLHMAQYLDMVV